MFLANDKTECERHQAAVIGDPSYMLWNELDVSGGILKE